MRINFVFRFFLIISIFEILFFSTSCQNFLKPNPDIQEERLRNAIRIHPKHEFGYLRLAQYLENQERYSETFHVLHLGQQNIPNSISLIRLEGTLLLGLGNYKESQIFYAEQIRKHPEDAMLYFDRAKMHWEIGKKDLALEDAKKAIDLKPKFFEALYLIGVILSHNTDSDSIEKSDLALEYFISASEINDKNPDLWLRISALWEKRNNLHNAKMAMLKAVDLSPESEPYLRRLAILQERELDEANQESSFQIAESLRHTLLHMNKLFPKNPWVHAHYGNWAWTQENFSLAENHLKLAVKLQPIYPWANFRLGIVYMSQKKWKLALSSFKEGLKYDPKNEWAIQKIGLALEMQGKNNEAIKKYEWLLENFSPKLILIMRLSKLYWDEFLFEKGEDILLRGHKIFPKETILIEKLVNYYDSRGLFEDASKILASFLKLVPNNSTALAKKGFYENELKKPLLALGYFEKALAISPDFEWARIHKIRILFDTKKIKKAENELKEFLKNNPDSEWALIELSKLKIDQKKFSKAEIILKNIILKHGESLLSLEKLGQVYKLQKKWTKAEEIFQKLTILNPNKSLIFTNLAFVQWKLNKIEIARLNVKKALYVNTNSVSARNLHLILQPEKKQRLWFGSDLAELLPILKILSSNTSVKAWDGIKTVRTDPFTRQILKNLHYLLEGAPEEILLEPKDMTSKQLSPWVHEKWGYFHDIIGNKDLAAKHFEVVLKALPENSWTHARLGRIYEKLEKFEKSRQHYIKFLKKHPTAFHVIFRLANVQILLGNEASTIELYEKIIANNPENDLVLNNLAWLFLTAQDRKLRNLEKGMELAKKSVKIFPTIDNLDTLAEAYFQTGKTKKAIQIIRKAAREVNYPSNRHTYLRKQLLRFRKGESSTNPPALT